MLSSVKRAVVIAVAVAGFMTGSPSLAHEDHNALGAGPGPSTQEAREQATQNASTAMPGMMAADESMDMNAMAEMEAGHAHETPGAVNKTFGQRLVSWLGRMHTMVIHFPIAMFIGAFGVELFGLWRRSRDYQHVAYVMLIVGALGAIVAAFLGWFAGGFYLSDRNPILMTHRWLGTTIAVAGVILVLMAAASRRTPEKSRTLLLAVLGTMVVAISIQGFLGGTFMHGGLRHLAF